jgi:hypothetical protein
LCNSPRSTSQTWTPSLLALTQFSIRGKGDGHWLIKKAERPVIVLLLAIRWSKLQFLLTAHAVKQLDYAVAFDARKQVVVGMNCNAAKAESGERMELLAGARVPDLGHPVGAERRQQACLLVVYEVGHHRCMTGLHDQSRRHHCSVLRQGGAG